MATEIDYVAARSEMAKQYQFFKIRSNKNAKEACDYLGGLLSTYSEFVETYIDDPSLGGLEALIESPLFKMRTNLSLGHSMYRNAVSKAKKSTGCPKRLIIDWVVSEVKKNDALTDSAKELLEEGDNWIIRKIIEAGLSVSELPPILLNLCEYDMDWACGLKKSK